MSNPLFTIVSPVYQSEDIVSNLVSEIKKNIIPITEDFEILLVEDGSYDGSWNAIERECRSDKRVKGIKLSRNFGQHYAITAGLDHASGTWVIVMDCDLQDLPSEIYKLYCKALEGFDIVLARRSIRKDTFFKKLFSRIFYGILGYLTGTSQDPAVANFGIYHQKVVLAMRLLREPIRYFPTMVKWVGFRRTTLDVLHGVRPSGKTSYNYKKLKKLALDIILANSDKPIKLTIKLGFWVALFSFGFGVLTFVRYYSGQIKVIGYTSLLISIWFLTGLTLIVLGIIGLYLGKTFEGVKQRPIYIVDQMVNNDESSDA
jgi:glycosyltransferase involved in cell wall biosynthesis